MYAWLGRKPWAFGWLVGLAFCTAATAAPPSAEQLRAWVRDLDADGFAAREFAMQQLIEAGSDASVFLRAAVDGSSPEMAWRATVIQARLHSERRTGTAVQTEVAVEQCSDEANAAHTDPPTMPDAPPEADIAQALAPPPQLPSIEEIGEQVLIADAYVSPDLAQEHGKILSRPAVGPRELRIEPAITALPADAPHPARSSPAVIFVRQSATRAPVMNARDSQPRLMNFLQRARTALGLPAR
jgi:hypothetical protein